MTTLVMLKELHTNPSKFFWVDPPPPKIRRVGMEFSEYNQKLIMSFWYNRLTSQRQFAPILNAHFWQVGLLDIVLSEYPDKSHNFRKFIFMTSSLKYSIVVLVS